MVRTWHEANELLETGVIAELQNKIDQTRPLNPEGFKKTHEHLKKLRTAMLEYDKQIVALQKLNASCAKQKVIEDALAGILKEARPLPRLGKTGVRHADAGGLAAKRVEPIRTLDQMLVAFRTDLKILMNSLGEVQEGLRDSLPLAEKGEFAAVMLSGRHGFGDKMPQLTNMFSAYERFYVLSVQATISATMQVYPKGYEWLTGKEKK